MTLTVGSLFSGIEGLGLGLERAGMEVRWQSEIDPYCCKVLAKHWPHVPNLGDIKTIDWKVVEPVDLVCGGYPCQPFSLAGVRGGEADPRHLWPHMRDAIRHLRPRLVLLENVPGHLSLGFGRVLGDLAGLGYDCEWDCIPAAAVGAPHLRYRVFVVAVRADTAGKRRSGEVKPRSDLFGDGLQPAQLRSGQPTAHVAHANGESEPGVTVDAVTRSGKLVLADTDSTRRRQDPRSAPGDEGADAGRAAPHDHVVDGDGESGRTGHMADTAIVSEREPSDEAIALAAERDARQVASGGGWWAVEPDVGRVAHGIPHRVDRLRALGNAVVPQVAEMIGRRIIERIRP